MLFNSYVFLFFGVVVFAAYFALSNWRARKLFLLAMSYIFYGAWNAPYLLLIIFSTVLDFFTARKMARLETKKQRAPYLALSFLGNLGVLSYFKYGGFAVENFSAALNLIGVQYEPMPWSILLPVGISFYTFQTLSYTIEVYRGNLKPTKSFSDFALFVTFFPQLVAGPIVRARNFLPQLVNAPRVTADRFGWGLSLALFGLFEKVAIADGIAAPVVNEIFGQEGILPLSTVIIGAVAFTVQILCDFSGYTLIAIGISACLGFKLPENFRAPYAALGYQDLWQRWHISMSGWFRDYLYGPIKKMTKKRTLYATMFAQIVTLVLIGIWHGAAWTFIVWGGYNALVICTEMSLRKSIGHWKFWKLKILVPVFGILTYWLFAFGAPLFRGESLGQALNMYKAIIVPHTNPYYVSDVDKYLIAVCITVIFLFHSYIRKRSFEKVAYAIPLPLRTLLLTGMILGVAVAGKSNETFIYFQF